MSDMRPSLVLPTYMQIMPAKDDLRLRAVACSLGCLLMPTEVAYAEMLMRTPCHVSVTCQLLPL